MTPDFNFVLFQIRAANSEGQGESIDFEGITLYAGRKLLLDYFHHFFFSLFTVIINFHLLQVAWNISM